MSRIRTIKPSFWKNEDLSALPESTHMLAAALLNYADDYGYFNAHPVLIKAECFPLRELSVSILESLRSLQAIGFLSLGMFNHRRYGRITKFSEHQRVSHPTESKIALLSITWDDSGKSPETTMNPPEPLRPEGNKEEEGNKEGKGESALTRSALPDDEAADAFFSRPTPNNIPAKAPNVRLQAQTDGQRSQQGSGDTVGGPPAGLKTGNRGTRLPEGWELPLEWRVAALAAREKRGLSVIGFNIDLEADIFANHFHGLAGAKGIKLDWRATFINWMLRADEFHRKPNGGDKAAAYKPTAMTPEQIAAADAAYFKAFGKPRGKAYP